MPLYLILHKHKVGGKKRTNFFSVAAHFDGTNSHKAITMIGHADAYINTSAEI